MVYEALHNMPAFCPHPQYFSNRGSCHSCSIIHGSLLSAPQHVNLTPEFLSLLVPQSSCSSPAFPMAGLSSFLGSLFKYLFIEKTVFTMSKIWPSITVYGCTLLIGSILPIVTYFVFVCVCLCVCARARVHAWTHMCSVVSNSLQSHGLYPTRFLLPEILKQDKQIP